MTQINCPACQATNKLPEARLVEQPRCGRCKAPLFSGEVMDLSGTNIDKTLKYNDIPVVVDCWASWCAPCRMFAPTFEAAARELEPTLRFARLDTEAEGAIAAQWQIRSIPTLIVFRNGREAGRVSGALSPPQFRQWLTETGATAA